MEKDPNGKGQHESGAKLDDGKMQPYLMMYGFSKALKAVAEVTTYGAKKYSPNGWASVRDPIPRYSNAKVRHMVLLSYMIPNRDYYMQHMRHGMH